VVCRGGGQCPAPSERADRRGVSRPRRHSLSSNPPANRRRTPHGGREEAEYRRHLG
jgi:hypothetical protein